MGLDPVLMQPCIPNSSKLIYPQETSGLVLPTIGQLSSPDSNPVANGGIGKMYMDSARVWGSGHRRYTDCNLL